MGRIASLVLIALFSCTPKPTTTTPTFDFEGSPDEVFENIINGLNDQGYNIDSFDSDARTVKTGHRTISLGDLERFITTDSDLGRFEQARVSYVLEVTESGGKTVVAIDATIAGFFRPKQAGTGGGAQATWQTQKSNGKAEQTLASSL